MNTLRRALVHVASTGSMVAANQTNCMADLPYTPDTVVTTVVKTSTNDVGARLAFPATTEPQATMLRVTIPPRSTTGWHRHPFQGFAYVLSGELTIFSKGHSPRVYYRGQGFAESIDTVHQGVNTGRVPVELLVLFLGIRGQPFALKAR